MTRRDVATLAMLGVVLWLIAVVSLGAADLAAHAGNSAAPYYVLAGAALVFATAGVCLSAWGARKADALQGPFVSAAGALGLNALTIGVIVVNELLLTGR
jgi:hypothetical protein